VERNFISLRPFIEHRGKTKFCATCGNIATQEALFNVGEEITLVEKYCDRCSEKVLKSLV
jgi:hypothetical protein